MARLRRCAHRVVWLNPLAADPRYEPLTRGMRAALPHVDHLLPGNSIASLEALAELMEEGLDMKDVLEDVDAWVARGDARRAGDRDRRQALGAAPARARRWRSTSTARSSGAVSGGCVEGAVVEVAEEVLGGGEPRLLHFGIADEEAWDVGLPCGGEIDVWVERYEP